jgi:hypothetical protein
MFGFGVVAGVGKRRREEQDVRGWKTDGDRPKPVESPLPHPAGA